MKTSIIILTYNNLSYTKKCLKSIRDYTDKNIYELIVIDNNSQDGTVEWLKSQENIKTIFNCKNMDFAKGCNQGINIASGDNILLLNNDVVVSHNWLDNLLNCLYSNDNIGAVGPLTNNCSNFQSIDISYNNLDEMHYFAKNFNISDSSKWEERLRLIGFCMLIKKEVVDKIGLLDELFTPSRYEDDDYSLRIRNEGYRLYLCKDTFIHHYGSITSNANPDENIKIMKLNRQKFINKWNIDPYNIIEIRKDITSLIKQSKQEAPTIMHLGCKAGGTLLDIKNEIPNAKLCGIEKTENYIGKIDHIAKIDIGDIKEINKYQKHYFDFIIITIYYESLERFLKELLNIRNYLSPLGSFIVSLSYDFEMSSINKKEINDILKLFFYSIYQSNNDYILYLKNKPSKEIITENNKKISFISCVNNEEVYQKSVDYIKKLIIPKGYEVECICIKDVNSMALGYNTALKQTDSKYKVYLHQDVLIQNNNFINDVLKIFQENQEVGMIGVAGCKILPSNAIWWESSNTYGKVIDSHTGIMKVLEFNDVKDDYEIVEAIDGLIMITQYNIPWRQDLFNGWHFYDISQSKEFIKANYKVAIPYQEQPWCIHDCGIPNMTNYEKYRMIFIQEYINKDVSTGIKENFVDNYKVCFICCVNDERISKKALEHIKSLNVPKGFKVQCIFMREVKSIPKAYNFAMSKSNAKYKVYIKDDLFIINANFIIDIINIFNKYKSIGMLGVIGSKEIPLNGDLRQSSKLYGKIIDTHTGSQKLNENTEIKNIVENVEVISEMIMVTGYDVKWREDIINIDKLYNISQCIEFNKHGYEIVIPKQDEPWCFYACGIINNKNSDETYEYSFIKKYLNNQEKEHLITNANNKRFVTLLLPSIKNVHLIKDVGMIPYIMHKYYGYESYIVVDKKNKYPYIENEVKGLKLQYIECTDNPDVDGYKYLKQFAHDIDILQLYSLHDRTLNLIRIYKDINPNGKVYIKLDADNSYRNIDYMKSLDKNSMDLISQCNLISVETKDLCSYLNNQLPFKIEYIPNGFYSYHYKFNKNNLVKYKDKKNVICTVGRIGSFQKATEILMEAFALVSNKLGDWKLKLIGPIEPDFQQYINDFFDKHKELKDKIIIAGEITDRLKLNKEYQEAKIFCLPSRWESFGIVLTEAMSMGCYVIISDIEPAKDITKNETYGDIFEVNNIEQLAEKLLKACKDEKMLKKLCNRIQKYAYKNFNWVKICGKINGFLE
jgi:GT2 family glycosyltransferase/glycosyltransferase involved in cell wall biosynthesis